MKMTNSTGCITSLAQITARPDKRKELFMTITSLLDRIRGEEGCRVYRLYGDSDEHDSFILMSEWESRTDWERHTRSEHFAVLLGSLELLSAEKRLDIKLLSPLDVTSAIDGREAATSAAF
jgi:quinol monooxygenase YgiN